MKDTGIVRRVDVLGRVVIPKEIRKILNISDGDPVEIFTEKDEIILKKFSPLSYMDGFLDCVCTALSRQIGKSVFICDKDFFLSASGDNVKQILGLPISKQLCNLIENRQTYLSSFLDGGAPIDLADNFNIEFCNQLAMPIKVDNEGVGCVIICDKSKENKISATQIEICELICEVLAGRFR